MSGVKKNKDVYLEFLRMIALFFVLYTHTGEFGMHHYRVAENRMNYWFSMAIASVSQMCVPLFFMISGAVLLKKEESIKEVLRKRVLRMFLVISVFVLVQFYLSYRAKPEIGFAKDDYFRMLYTGGAITQQWFLYAYFSFLLILPFLQKMAKVIPSNSWFLYLFVLQLLINGLGPILEFENGYKAAGVDVPFLLNIIFYPLIGYYIQEKSKDLFYKGKVLLGAILVAGLAAVWNAVLNHSSYLETGNLKFLEIFVPIYAFTLFIIVRAAFHKWKLPNVVNKVICFGGAGVFGAYLFEPQLREGFEWIYFGLHSKIYSYPALVVWLLASMCVGIIIFGIVKKIPVLGKLF